MRPQDELSATDRNVAVMVWKGMTNLEIARIIGESEQMVKNHLRKVFDKLGVWSRLELALYVASHGGAAWNRSAPSGNMCIVDEKKAKEAPGGMV